MCRVNELVLKRRFEAGRKIEITKEFLEFSTRPQRLKVSLADNDGIFYL